MHVPRPIARALSMTLPAFLILIAPAVLAQESAKLTVDDLIKDERASGLKISRRGDLAVWIKSTVIKIDDEEKRVSHLWLTRLDSRESFQLTRGSDSASSPDFSPDGKTIAFLTSRKPIGGDAKKKPEGNQIWAIRTGGGEAYPVTKRKRPVRSYAWRDSERLIFAADESASLWEAERKEGKDTAVVIEDAQRKPPVRLFEIAASGGDAKRLTTNDDWISGFDLSRDGARAVVRIQRSLSYQFDQKTPPRTTLLDLDSGVEKPLFTDFRLRPGQVRWTHEGDGFYFTNEYSSHPTYRQATVTEIHFHDIEAGSTRKIDLGTDRGLARDLLVTPDGFIALLADGIRYRPARFTRAAGGWSRTDISGEHAESIDGWAIGADGDSLAYRHSRANVSPQWFAGRLGLDRIEDEEAITKLNQGYSKKPLGRVDFVNWTGAKNETVEGLLHYPLDWTEGERRPLVVQIHGGPTGTDRDTWRQSWSAPIILMRQRGAFVLQVNYHGSGGYGLDWAESIGEGKAYDLETPDIEAGVDEMIRRGLVDPDRLACIGWSYGGILAADLITKSERWKVASVGAADVEWISDWANVDFGAAYDNYYFGGSPFEKLQVYIDKSPFFRLPKVKTPTIVFTGDADRNVPPHQSWSLFRAMQQKTDTPVRLVIFPGEPHSLRKIAHQRRKLEEDMLWFDKHFFKPDSAPPESVKKGSKLAGLIGAAAARRVGDAYGVEISGVIAPETVLFEGLEVGRFEVTRAQFASIIEDADASTAHASSADASMPATAMTFDQAREYVRRLAERASRPYRLPTVAEAEKLAKTAGSGGNTLDHWAGYAHNPEDAANISERLAALGRPSTLLMPVGSLPGKGEPMIFDLDGNAAEWAVDEQGGGRPIGPSADRAAKSLDENGRPAADYIGLRVVVGDAGAPSE
jgi:dipeptidyl aminopeptidase/acylaminoacyl peptidase